MNKTYYRDRLLRAFTSFWSNVNWGSTDRTVFRTNQGWSTDACYNLDKPWEHYVRLKKPNTKGHIGMNLDTYEMSKTGRSKEKIGWGLSGAWGENRECPKQYSISFWGKWKCLKFDCVYGYTTVNKLKSTELYTLNEWIVMWIISQYKLLRTHFSKKTYRRELQI